MNRKTTHTLQLTKEWNKLHKRGLRRRITTGMSAFLIVILLAGWIPPYVPQAFSAEAASLENNAGAGVEPWYYLVADVVNAANGNLFFTARDISVSALGFDLELTRAYNSLHHDQDGPFGYGWTFNYGLHLSFDGDQVTVHGADGSAHTYVYSSTLDAYVPPPGVHQRLTSNGDGYTLWTKDNTHSGFDADGRLQVVTDTNGNRLTFTYSDGKLTQVADDSGLALTLYYSGAHVNWMEDPLGRQIEYAYDEAGNLVQVTDAMGHVISYGYHPDHSLTWYANRLSQTLFFVYDEAGRVTDLWYADGQERSYLSPSRLFNLYYLSGQTVVTNARGYSSNVEFGPHGEPVRVVDAVGNASLREWDEDLNRISFTDFRGNATRSEYDDYGNRILRTDPLSYTTAYVWENVDTPGQYLSLQRVVTDALGMATTYEYDASGNLITTTNPLGDVATNTYDAWGYLIQEVDYGGNTTLYEYDTHGNGVRVTDSLNGVTEYAYDAVGRTLVMTNTRGFATRYEYDANDRRTRVIDALGNETLYIYNAVGSLIEEITPRSSTQWGYNVLGQPNVITYTISGASYFRTDRNANRTRETDPAGNRTSFEYDALDRPVATTDALGNTEYFTYDADSNLASHTDENGHTTYYAYDALGQVVAITDALGNVEQYVYDALGQTVAITDALGYVTRFEYDPLGRTVAVTDAPGNVERYAYDAVGNRTVVTDTRGFATHYEYDALGGLVRQTDALGYTTEWVYDGLGNTVVVTDARGFATIYEYDPLGRKIEEIDPLGNATEWAYDEVGNTVAITNARGYDTTYTYDLLDRLVQEVNGLGGVTEYAYDVLGNRIVVTDTRGFATRYEYDSLGRLLRETDALGQVTNLSYDAVGNTTVVTDTRGFVTTYEYDALNRLIRETDPGGAAEYAYDAVGNQTVVTDALGQVTNLSYDGLGQTVVVTDALGNATHYTYDAGGNRRTWTDRRGYTTEHVYDALGQMIERIDSEANPTYYAYDGLGNIVAITDTLGNVTTYHHDALNRLIAVDNGLGVRAFEYEYDEVGNRTAEINALGNRTEFTYDALDRLIAKSDPLGNTISYQYDAAGNLVSATDANDNTHSYDYDALGRLVTKTNSLDYVTTYEYDAANNLVRTTDALTSSTEYTYDYAGRILTITTEAGRTTIYEYDALGNLIRRTDPNGQVTEYDYDGLGRRVEVSYPDGGGAYYVYDTDGHVLTVTNKPATLGGLGDVTSYTYDGLNRVLAHTVDYGDFTKTISYDYDGVGNLTNVTNPDWGENKYEYDAVGRLVTVTAPLAYNNAVEDVTVYSYDAVGRRVGVAHGEDYWWSAYSYDEAGRVVTATVTTLPRGGFWPFTAMATYIYTYDGVGNKTVEERAWVIQGVGRSDERVDFTYDAVNQVILERGQSIASTYITTLTYDGVGNPQMGIYQEEGGETIIKTCSYDPDHYRTSTVVDDGATTDTMLFTRDLNGNLTDIVSGTQHTTLAHDYENRIITITHSDSASRSTVSGGQPELHTLTASAAPKGSPVATDILRARYSPEGHKLADWRGRGFSESTANKEWQGEGFSGFPAKKEWRYIVRQLTATAGWFLHSQSEWGEELGWANYLYQAGQNARWGHFTAYGYEQLSVYRGWEEYSLGVDFEGPVMTYRLHSGLAPLEGTDESGNPQNFENPGISGGKPPSSAFEPSYVLDNGLGSTAIVIEAGGMPSPSFKLSRSQVSALESQTCLGMNFEWSFMGFANDAFTEPFSDEWDVANYMPIDDWVGEWYALYEGAYDYENELLQTGESTFVLDQDIEPPAQEIPGMSLLEPGAAMPCGRSNLGNIIGGVVDIVAEDIVEPAIGSFVEEAMNELTAKVIEKIIGRVAGRAAGMSSRDTIRDLVDVAMGESGITAEVGGFVANHLMTNEMKQTIKDSASEAAQALLGQYLKDKLNHNLAEGCLSSNNLTNLALNYAEGYIKGKIGALAALVAKDMVNSPGVDRAVGAIVNRMMGTATRNLAKKIAQVLATKVGTKFLPVVGQMIAAWDLGWEIGEGIRSIPMGDGSTLGEAIDQWAAETYGEGWYQFQEDAEANGGGVTGYIGTWAEYWWRYW